ncbi:MAG: hypothetical protein JSS60_08700 [Verrucomicrobia bacterium]|nr:hypothetical protein [Verrucomicrobiota bacterium]
MAEELAILVAPWKKENEVPEFEEEPSNEEVPSKAELAARELAFFKLTGIEN